MRILISFTRKNLRNLKNFVKFISLRRLSGLAGLGANTSLKDLRTKSLAETGWTADGERFVKMEIAAALGRKQQIAYLTESGKRFLMPQN